MKNLIVLLLCFLSIANFGQVKIGTNPETITVSSLLELESNFQGLLIPRIASTSMIVTPVNGMLLYDLSVNCIKSYENGNWSNCLSLGRQNPQNVVVNCSSSALNGSYSQNVATVSNNTFTIVYTNNTLTSVSITKLTSDITLSGASAGLTVSLPTPVTTNIASGASAILTYTIGGTPVASSGNIFTATFAKLGITCAKTATIGDPISRTTNGTAIVDFYNCALDISPARPEIKILSGIGVVDGLKKHIVAHVTKTGSYDIKAERNGIIFSDRGFFNELGDHEIELTATGQATGSGTFNFALNTEPGCSFPVKLYTTANWMGAFPDSTNISQLSIPGTHDSGARIEVAVLSVDITGTAKAQELSIPAQLNAGVRFLDIRVSVKSGALMIFHGRVNQEISFITAMNQVKSFLNTNPSEAVIVSLEWENNEDSDNLESDAYDLFKTYLASNSSLWNVDTLVPNLATSRNKITLFKRIKDNDETNEGIPSKPWYPRSSATLKVQDDYYLENSNNLARKWNRVNSLMLEAHAHAPDDNKLFINFTSGYVDSAFCDPFFGHGCAPDLLIVKNYINPRVKNFFTDARGKYGTLLMDYIDEELGKKIVKTNFYRFLQQ